MPCLMSSLMANNPKPWFDVGVGESTKRLLFELFEFDEETSLRDSRLLDFGCGAGRYMRVFSEVMEASNIYGVDVDGEAFETLEAGGFRCKKLQSCQVRLDFPDSFFRFVFSSNVIEHIPHEKYLGYLKEIYRVLEPGGMLVIGAPNYPFKRIYDMQTAWRNRADAALRDYYLFDDPTHVNFVSVLSAERDLRRVGFRELAFETGSLPFQGICPLFRGRWAKRHLRAIGNKFVGKCRKPGLTASIDKT